MGPGSDSTVSEVRLDFFYDFHQKEFVIRFESRSQAAAYQTRNSEARIYDDRRYEVWLPVGREMRYLRSSSLGMAVVFDSEDAARRWRDKTILGDQVTFDRGTYGVYFSRSWSHSKLRERIGDFRNSLQPVMPYPPDSHHSRPVSPRGGPPPINVKDIEVGRTRQSERTDF